VQVLADGVDIRELDAKWFRSQLGVVSQEPNLFSETVAANIAYGLEGISQVCCCSRLPNLPGACCR
jgi:ABC-type multidrug transport system fused ATPase/permease subunit